MYIEANDNNGYCDSCGSVIRSEGGYYNKPHDEGCKYVLQARLKEIEKLLGVRYVEDDQEYENIPEQE